MSFSFSEELTNRSVRIYLFFHAGNSVQPEHLLFWQRAVKTAKQVFPTDRRDQSAFYHRQPQGRGQIQTESDVLLPA
jgi:hypothetical protein